jgi:hypothetical protein
MACFINCSETTPFDFSVMAPPVFFSTSAVKFAQTVFETVVHALAAVLRFRIEQALLARRPVTFNQTNAGLIAP